MEENDTVTLLKENVTFRNFSQKPTLTGQTGIDTSASFFKFQFFQLLQNDITKL